MGREFKSHSPCHVYNIFIYVCIYSGYSVAWYRACFGSKRSQVQILLSRPISGDCSLIGKSIGLWNRGLRVQVSSISPPPHRLVRLGHMVFIHATGVRISVRRPTLMQSGAVVACQPHKLKVADSNPASASNLGEVTEWFNVQHWKCCVV